MTIDHQPSAISHSAFSEQLMSFLEGDTDDATHASMERHAQQCAECGALLAEVRALRVEASKLPELTPSRDLWSGIAARIEAPVVPIGTVSGAFEAVPAVQRSAGARRWIRGSMAAAALVGAVGLGYFTGVARPVATVASSDSTDAADTTAMPVQDGQFAIMLDGVPLDWMAADSLGGSASALAPSTASAQFAVATLSADYDREITRLRALVDERRNQLDPVTVAIIEKNLRVIDVAITESKKAIARDPASRFLIESLNHSLESKVELLRIAAALPSRG